jgi:RNA polymerase sigma factor (TIGR02999 family)
VSARAPQNVTQLLLDWSAGDRSALDALVPLVYDELRRLARGRMRGEPDGHTLETAALVNEAYLRLVDYRSMRWENRAHFFAVAAQAMRRVLVDHARARRSAKRGGGAARVTLDERAAAADGPAVELIALDDALERLAAIDPRKARVVEMWHFAGLEPDEIAAVLGTSAVTVRREWRIAKAWLLREIVEGNA